MVCLRNFAAAAVTLLTAVEVAAHPGHDHSAEIAERAAFLANLKVRDLSHCSAKLKARGVEAKMVQRRKTMHEELQKKALLRRDFATVLNTTHHSNLTGLTTDTNWDDVFASNNSASCILAPETTQGPYYVTGEYFRKDISETQAGVPLYLNVQLIDTNTCEPISGAALDAWHCNSTGVYSGVVASGNGNSGEGRNINATFNRGIQASDDDGVVEFITTFPGHYVGRTNHIHIAAHVAGNWTLLPNNTITGGESTAHVGQLFFDQDLITTVETVEPYVSNTQALTTNVEDDIFAGEAVDVDPVVEYVYVNDADINDGILSWVAVGLDATANYTVSPAVIFGETGGHTNPNGGGSGGPGGPGGPPSSFTSSASSTSSTPA